MLPVRVLYILSISVSLWIAACQQAPAPDSHHGLLLETQGSLEASESYNEDSATEKEYTTSFEFIVQFPATGPADPTLQRLSRSLQEVAFADGSDTVTQVTVVVTDASGSDVSGTINLTRLDPIPGADGLIRWGGTLVGLPTGEPLTFTTQASNAGGSVLYRDVMVQTLNAGEAASVNIVLDANQEVEISSGLPRVVSLTMPSEIEVNADDVTLSFNISFGSSVNYLLSLVDAAGVAHPTGGTLSNTSGTHNPASGNLNVLYDAPSSVETVFVEIELIDPAEPDVQVVTRFPIPLVSAGALSTNLTVRFGPSIIGLRVIRASGSITLDPTVENPIDGTLTYQWTGTGDFSGVNSTASTLVINSFSAGQSGNIILTVTDQEGHQTTLTYTLAIDDFTYQIISSDSPPLDASRGQIAAGVMHVCAILDNQDLKCWGDGDSGKLGQGNERDEGDNSGEMGNSLPDVDLGTGRHAIEIAAGDNHTCAILDNNDLKCWGDAFSGKLGGGNSTDKGDHDDEMGSDLPEVNLGTGRHATQISAGEHHTCAVLDNSELKCWGNNDSGQLGLGDTIARGDNAGEMGDDLSEVNLGSGRTALQVSAGKEHTCVLMDNYQVKCWGDNTSGQLGIGSTASYRGRASDMGDALAAVNLGTGRTALQVVAGYRHTCALLDNSQVKCWGRNSSGQLGLGDNTHRGRNSADMGDALPQVSLGAGRSARRLMVGDNHTCAIMEDQMVKCWGSNSSGQLGQGHSNDRGDNSGEMGDLLPHVNLGTDHTAIQMVGKSGVTCVMLTGHEFKCWGLNNAGQLGQGDTTNRGTSSGQMGDNLVEIDLD